MELANSLATPGVGVDVADAPTSPPQLQGDHLRIALRETRDERRVLINVDLIRITASDTPTSVFTYAFEFEGDVLPPPQTTANMALVASLFQAMEMGLPVHVVGKVSRLLLINLEEFQDAWTSWCPELYHRVAVHADEVVDDATSVGNRAVMLYSGGVDANFTLVNQLFGDQPYRRNEIVAALLIHGYDVPLDREDIFEERRQRAEKILAGYGIPLIAVRSNWRNSNKQDRDYTYGHGTALSACLHAYENIVDVGIIASDRNYSYLSSELNGSNPITNSLLSSSRLRLLTDGARFTRTAKAAVLSQHPALRDRLQVCQRGFASNCCVCEKCIRTILCFEANHVPAGQAFPRNVEAWRLLLNFYWIRASVIPYYQDIVATSRRHGSLGGKRWLIEATIIMARVKTWFGEALRRKRLHG